MACPRADGEFTAQTDQGAAVQGIATFIEYGGTTYQLTAYATSDRYPSYGSALPAEHWQFRPPDRSRRPCRQPMRLRLLSAFPAP